MKIACIGNMNNNLFSLARYLRDKGFAVDLLLLENELANFHPSADTFDLSYQDYSKNLSWGHPFRFREISISKIEKDLKNYEFIIGCGTTPAFLKKIGRVLDIFAPYGSDLYEYPFFKIVNPRYLRTYYSFSRSQAHGIRETKYLNLDDTNEKMERVVSRTGFKGKWLKMGLPMIYTPLFNPQTIQLYYDRSHWYQDFYRIRQNHDLVVFHHSRHAWKTSPDPFTWKDNDKLFRGLAAFKKLKKNTRACIITCEYGPDIYETKKLIEELGIEDSVFWFPQMTRKDLMTGISLADFGSGEFHMSWLSCGTVYENLAMAKPLLHYREDEIYKNTYPELYPMVNIRTPEDVANALLDFTARPEFYRKMGESGRQWLEKYVISESLNQYLQILQS